MGLVALPRSSPITTATGQPDRSPRHPDHQCRLVVDQVRAVRTRRRLDQPAGLSGHIDIPLDRDGERETQYQASLNFLLHWLRANRAGWSLAAVGHRVVHGGRAFFGPDGGRPRQAAATRAIRHAGSAASVAQPQCLFFGSSGASARRAGICRKHHI